MEPTYYTPTIEEFHVGLEYEVQIQEAWVKLMFDEYYGFYDGIISSTGIKFNIKDKLIANELRVKHLDRTDIEECGWRGGENDGIWNFAYYWMIVKATAVEIEDERKNFDIGEGSYTPPIFNGTILNKSELKFIMARLGIKTEPK